MGGQMIGTVLTKSKLILGEGKDESYFFDALLQHMGISDVDNKEIMGKDRFGAGLDALIGIDGFSNVKKIAIFRDAESSRDATFRSIQHHLGRCQLPVPASIGQYATYNGVELGVFILPGNAEFGMLENLCLDSVKDHPVMPHVDILFDSLKTVLKKREPPDSVMVAGVYYYPSNEPKAKAQAFLSGMHKIKNSVGTAAQKRYWNFDHASMSDIKDFLERLR
jgi:hypothetical protein